MGATTRISKEADLRHVCIPRGLDHEGKCSLIGQLEKLILNAWLREPIDSPLDALFRAQRVSCIKFCDNGFNLMRLHELSDKACHRTFEA